MFEIPNSKRVLQEENLSIYLIKKPKKIRDERQIKNS